MVDRPCPALQSAQFSSLVNTGEPWSAGHQRPQLCLRFAPGWPWSTLGRSSHALHFPLPTTCTMPDCFRHLACMRAGHPKSPVQHQRRQGAGFCSQSIGWIPGWGLPTPVKVGGGDLEPKRRQAEMSLTKAGERHPTPSQHGGVTKTLTPEPNRGELKINLSYSWVGYQAASSSGGSQPKLETLVWIGRWAFCWLPQPE